VGGGWITAPLATDRWEYVDNFNQRALKSLPVTLWARLQRDRDCRVPAGATMREDWRRCAKVIIGVGGDHAYQPSTGAENVLTVAEDDHARWRDAGNHSAND
jgi:hypothetical protein